MAAVTEEEIVRVVTALATGHMVPGRKLLHKIPPTCLIEAMIQEIEDGAKARDFEFLRGLDSVLRRAVGMRA
ncbi:MAG: hypothetical protein HQM03_20850 [Magnetococcales bacterium]|nr:hypothetical protein [Magnetococcales bacterium]